MTGLEMARMKRRRPYNPAKATSAAHDRRTTDLLRNALVEPIEIDDPLEAGGRLIVMRSVRNDPLAALHARGHIDEAQYHGGRAFQYDFETAERGPKAVDPSKEAVDGGQMPEPITEAQQRAAKRLAAVYRALGQDGTALLHDTLIHMRTRAQVALSRGLAGERWQKYFGMRIQEILHCVAKVYGFATEKTGKKRV